MGIGAIGQNTNLLWGNAKIQNKVKQGDFQNTMCTVESSGKSIQIHGLYGSVDENGSQVVGGWGDAIAGTSTTVYKPANFNPAEPVYTMKIWDSNNNLIEERSVNLDEVDINNCDTFDMYAYSCYLSNSGKYPDAMDKYFMMPAQKNGFDTNYDLSNMYEKQDWISVLKDFMDMQYKLGNHYGYMDYKKFHDFLADL